MTRSAPYDRDTALDAALTLFWRKGYHATSLKDLEAELGMRPGSIYAAFHSKETLFRTVLERYATEMRRGFETALAGSESPLGGLADYVRDLGGLLDATGPSRACMLVKTLLEATSDQREIIAEAKEYLAAIEASFARVFEAARQRGEIAPDADPARLARRLQTYIFGLKVHAQRETSSASMHMLAEDVAADLEAMRVSGLPARAAPAAPGPRA